MKEIEKSRPQSDRYNQQQFENWQLLPNAIPDNLDFKIMLKKKENLSKHLKRVI
jgi:hypothetical protein